MKTALTILVLSFSVSALAIPIKWQGCPSKLSELSGRAKSYVLEGKGKKSTFFFEQEASTAAQVLAIKVEPTDKKKALRVPLWYYKSVSRIFGITPDSSTPSWSFTLPWVHSGMRAIAASGNEKVLLLSDFVAIDNENADRVETGTEVLLIHRSGEHFVLDEIFNVTSRSDACDVAWLGDTGTAVVLTKDELLLLDTAEKHLLSVIPLQQRATQITATTSDSVTLLGDSETVIKLYRR